MKEIEEPCLSVGQNMTLKPHDFIVPCTTNPYSDSDSEEVVTENPNSVKFYRKYGNIEDENINLMMKDYLDYQFETLSNKSYESDNNSFLLVGTSDAHKCDAKVKLLFDEELCKKTFTYGNCLHKEKVPHFRKELVVSISLFHLNNHTFKISNNFVYFAIYMCNL